MSQMSKLSPGLRVTATLPSSGLFSAKPCRPCSLGLWRGSFSLSPPPLFHELLLSPLCSVTNCGSSTLHVIPSGSSFAQKSPRPPRHLQLNVPPTLQGPQLPAACLTSFHSPFPLSHGCYCCPPGTRVREWHHPPPWVFLVFRP